MIRSIAILLSLVIPACAGGATGTGSVDSASIPVCSSSIIGVGRISDAGLDSIRGLVQQTTWMNASVRVTDQPVEFTNRARVVREMARLYPRELRDRGIEASMSYFVVMDTAGVPVLTHPLESSGHFSLDQPSHAVVRSMRFSPAIVDGCRTAGAQIIPLEWSIH